MLLCLRCKREENNKWRHLTDENGTRNVFSKAKKKAFAAGVRPVLGLEMKELNEIFHLVCRSRAICTDLKSYLQLDFTSKFTKEPF